MITIRHKDTAEVLLEVPADTLRGIALEHAALAGADLSGCDLSHADLKHANLQGANLDRAELVGALLDGCDLTKASLVEAKLNDASLQKAKLRRANLNGCQMRFAKLAGADLSKASLIAVDLSMADLRANLTEAELRSANLRGANLTDATLIRTNLSKADLSGAILIRATLHEANLKEAKLDGVARTESAHPSELALVGKTVRVKTVEDEAGGGAVQLRIECPHCFTPQRVPRTQLDHQLNCKFCQGSFYLDRAGTVHDKKPVVETDWTPEVDKTKVPEHADWEWRREWTMPALIAGFCLICVPVAWMVTSAVVSGWYGPPSDLVGRATYVGHAFVNGDEQGVLAVTEPNDAALAQRWLKQHRTTDWNDRAKQGGVQVESKELFKNAQTGIAKVETQIVSENGSFTSASKAQLRLETMWRLNEQQEWVFAPQYMASNSD